MKPIIKKLSPKVLLFLFSSYSLTQITEAAGLGIAENVSSIYQRALVIGGLVALGIIIYAGVLYTASGGSASRRENAKKWIKAAIIGLILLFSSFLILNTINPNLTLLKNPSLEVSPGAPPGAAHGFNLPQLIANFYKWTLGIGGLIALGIIIYAGTLYVISPGSASRQEDAKKWIFGAVLGLLLLFGSYVILFTINPELTKLKFDLSNINLGSGSGGNPAAGANLDIARLIATFYKWALGLGGLIVLAVLGYAGFTYATSAGNASRQDDAKKWIFGAVIGLFLLFGSYAILNTINPNLTRLSIIDLQNIHFGGAGPSAPATPAKPGSTISLNIASKIGALYQWALGVGALIALAVLIYGGLLYAGSAGNQSRLDDAKKWIFGAIIGLFLLFGSYLILFIINPELTKLKDLKIIANEAAQPFTPSPIPSPSPFPIISGATCPVGDNPTFGAGDFCATSQAKQCGSNGCRFSNCNSICGPGHDNCHGGTDLVVPVGTPVYAFEDGVIIVPVSFDGAGGYRLWLKGNSGATYYYAHLLAPADCPIPALPAGTKVKAGDPIGCADTTGNAAGGPSHLHFEIHPTGVDNIVADPFPLLQNACKK